VTQAGKAESSGDPNLMQFGSASWLILFVQPASEARPGSEIASTLNIDPIAATAVAGQPFQRARNVLGNLMRGLLRHQRKRAGFDAEPFQKFALGHGPMGTRAEILGGAHQRLKIDMAVTSARRGFSGVGEAVAGQWLEGIAGVAAT